jgi:hypothetical protein
METTITVTVTTPDGTTGVTDAISYVLDNPLNYPDDTDVPEWDVSISERAAGPLQEGVDSVLATVAGTVFYSADGSEAIVLLRDEHYAVSVDSDGDTQSAYLTWVRPENEDELGWSTGWGC